MQIDYQSDGFPNPGPVINGHGTLPVTWNDLLWAGITIGRPNWHYVLSHGESSLYEALFRLSAVRLAVEQRGPAGSRFYRTTAAKHLDPSEKGALHYFLGLTLSKLFVEELLDTPWMLHLDVFRAQLGPRLLTGRSRPDLVGQSLSGVWVAIESKGRASSPDDDCRDKAKRQAENIVEVNGTPVHYHIGAIAYFEHRVLEFYWRDPQPGDHQPRSLVHLDIGEEELSRKYYLPIITLVARNESGQSRDSASAFLPDGDVGLDVFRPVFNFLLAEQWTEARRWCVDHSDELRAQGYHRDGVRVKSGESWSNVGITN